MQYVTFSRNRRKFDVSTTDCGIKNIPVLVLLTEIVNLDDVLAIVACVCGVHQWRIQEGVGGS